MVAVLRVHDGKQRARESRLNEHVQMCSHQTPGEEAIGPPPQKTRRSNMHAIEYFTNFPHLALMHTHLGLGALRRIT